MNKYFTVFKISWQNGFIYRLDFLLWRVRNIILILTVYFLWDAIFQRNGAVLGYTKTSILTYVFLTLIIRSIVFSAKSIDAAGEIADGRLSNYLLKPLNFHGYWFTRDLADKFLNILFSVFEVAVLIFLLHPPLFWQSNPVFFLLFLLSLIIAILLNFLLGTIASNFSFWTPGNAWGFWFIFMVFRDLVGGLMFPLDVFPKGLYNLIMLTPFPYLLFFPAQVYLGKLSFADISGGFFVTVFWVFIFLFLMGKEWQIGVKSYQAEGR